MPAKSRIELVSEVLPANDRSPRLHNSSLHTWNFIVSGRREREEKESVSVKLERESDLWEQQVALIGSNLFIALNFPVVAIIKSSFHLKPVSIRN